MRRWTIRTFVVALIALTVGIGVPVAAHAGFTELGTVGSGPGAGAGQLDGPVAVAVAPDGAVYVAEQANNRISKFAPGGAFERAWGTDVTVGGGTGFEVCTTVCKAGTGGIGAGDLSTVDDVDVSADGSAVYIADSGNRRVSQYAPDGTFVRAFGKNVIPGGFTGPEVCTASCTSGTAGTEGGAIERPGRLAVAPSGDVYVVETINLRVSQFTGAGVFVRAFGQDVDSGGGTGLETCTATCQAGENDPFGDWEAVEVTPAGEVWVTDTQVGGQVTRFSAAGAYLGAFAQEGSGPGAVLDPRAIAVNGAGEVLLAQQDPPAVFRYSPGPVFVESVSVGAVFADAPDDVEFGLAGDVYVAQRGRDRVVRYAVSGTPSPPPVVPSAPAAASMPAPTPAPAPQPVSAAPTRRALPAAASVILLPSTRRCVSRRNFRIRLREPRGLRIRSATVALNGRRVATRSGRRVTAPVDLRGLPRGRFTVRIVVTLTDGRKLTSTRRYRTCAPKRR